MSGLSQRTSAVLQLKKEFQPADAVSTAASEAAKPQRVKRPLQPLIGQEHAHSWLLPWIFGALFVIGVVTAGRGWQQVEHAAVTSAWPFTRGVVISSEMQTFSGSEGMRYRPVVTYLYRVGKQEMLGSRIGLLDPMSGYGEEEARGFSERYRLHGEVLVYYNPDHVNESVLELSAPRSAYLMINLGLALATASAALVIITLRASLRAPRRRAVAVPTN